MLKIYIWVAAVLTAAMFAGCVLWVLQARRSARDAALKVKYINIIMLWLMTGKSSVPRFPHIWRIGARRLLTEAVALLTAVTSGLDTKRLQRLVTGYGLDTRLLRRIRFARGYNRARLLSQLSHMPTARAAAKVERYTRSRNRYVRFFALMTQMAADPATLLRRIENYHHPLSKYGVTELMGVLRRGMLPIAYEPLMESPSDNLRRIGLGVVRHFHIKEAEDKLLHMALRDGNPELAHGALYTLCSMHRPLSHREVRERIARMDAHQRRALLRHMTHEGYSTAALERLLCDDERPYYQTLIRSYKRCLA